MALNMIWDVIMLKSRGIHWLVGVRFRCKLTLTTDVLVSVLDDLKMPHQTDWSNTWSVGQSRRFWWFRDVRVKLRKTLRIKKKFGEGEK